MAYLNKPSLLAATLVVTTWAFNSAKAAEPPVDLCTLLPAAELSKLLGQTYDSPQKSIPVLSLTPLRERIARIKNPRMPGRGSLCLEHTLIPRRPPRRICSPD
jgi:hypothetical protein